MTPSPFVRRLLAVLLGLTSWQATPRANAEEVRYDLRIERGHVPVNMRLIRVKQGDAVRLRWRSDQITILHLHGYDIETTAKPGVVAEMSFVARATGRFAVSVHKSKRDGGHTHEPPLVYVEVYPR